MKADLHIHSSYSADSRSRIPDILRRARELGFGAIAIADHNTVEGAIEAMDIAEDIIILPAIEISSREGHIIAYNIIEEIPRDLSVAETIRRIHDAGGIAVAPHPYRMWSGLGEIAVIENDFDAIEAMNGRSTDRDNERSKLLARKLGFPVTAGSDSHDIESIGSCYTVFPDECISAEDLVRSIIDGRTSVAGRGRRIGDSLKYATKCVAEWIGRGMRRI